jgi:glycosyltransferase involved in cell wall biosynthesis
VGAVAPVARLMRRRGVILATQNFSASYAADFIAKLTGRPWVMCVHGPITKVLEAAPVSARKRRFLQRLYRRAPVIVCSSQTSLDSLRDFCDLGAASQRIEVIRNAAMPAFFSAAARDTPLPSKRIGFVGRLSHEKQPMLLLQALRALPADWRLEVVGTGPLDASFRQAAADEIAQGRVHMAGLQPVTPATYRRWQATMLCSSYEGYPLVLLESLASGVPVVATPIPAAVEMLGRHAPYMLAREATAQAMADAVLDVASRDVSATAEDIASINREHDPAAFVATWDDLLSRTVGR